MQIALKEKKGIAGAFLWKLTCEKLLYAQIARKILSKQTGTVKCFQKKETEKLGETEG